MNYYANEVIYSHGIITHVELCIDKCVGIWEYLYYVFTKQLQATFNFTLNLISFEKYGNSLLFILITCTVDGITQ